MPRPSQIPIGRIDVTYRSPLTLQRMLNRRGAQGGYLNVLAFLNQHCLCDAVDTTTMRERLSILMGIVTCVVAH